MAQIPSQLPTADGGGAMFDRIAARYDLLNRLTSLGLDHRWRRLLVQSVTTPALPAGAEVLDLATGTADVALALLAAAPGVAVVGLDPSEQMLAVGAQKWLRRSGGADLGRLSLRQGRAEALPFADAQFAAATMAFGIRNVPGRAAALAELLRVVAPGGVVAILELTDPASGVGGVLPRLWVHRVVPAIGALLSGAPAYRYLATSIAAFPAAPAFAQQLREAGFVRVHVRRLAFGAAHLFVCHVPNAQSH